MSKILLVAGIVWVTIIIYVMFCIWDTWPILHLITNSSVSVDMTFIT